MYFIGILTLRYFSLKEKKKKNQTTKKTQQQTANYTLILSSEEL